MLAQRDGKVTVAIVDDHVGVAELIADGLRATFDVVGIAASGTEAVALVRQHHPRVTLVDVQLGEENGLTLIRPLSRLKTRVVLFTMHDVRQLRGSAIKAGASGIIAKNQPKSMILEAINTVADGGQWFPELRSERPGEKVLGSVRLQILRLLRDGLNEREIAGQLHRSKQTIEFHVRKAKEMLDASTLAELVAEGIRRGYIPPPGLDGALLISPRS